MKILVTGAEQYIGGAIARFLLQEGYDIVPYVFTDNAQKELSSLCQKNSIQCIIHSAELSQLRHIQAIIQALQQNRIPYFILLSGADVYGIPKTDKVEEKQQRKPITQNGILLSQIEEEIEHFSIQNPHTRITVLRLFMVTGADMQRGIGPVYQNNSTFMVRLMRSFANKNIRFVFYGDDYATQDGYPIRDFVHIVDVCEAVIHTIQHLPSQEIPHIEYNIGSGQGESLNDVVNRASEVLQMPIHTTIGERKENEVARLVADVTRAKLLLEWKPRYPLDQCIATTWHWCIKQI